MRFVPKDPSALTNSGAVIVAPLLVETDTLESESENDLKFAEAALVISSVNTKSPAMTFTDDRVQGIDVEAVLELEEAWTREPGCARTG